MSAPRRGALRSLRQTLQVNGRPGMTLVREGTGTESDTAQMLSVSRPGSFNDQSLHFHAQHKGLAPYCRTFDFACS